MSWADFCPMEAGRTGGILDPAEQDSHQLKQVADGVSAKADEASPCVAPNIAVATL